MNDWKRNPFHHEPEIPGWEAFSAQLGPAPVSEFEVARLRRRVRRAIEAEAPVRFRLVARAAGVAACLAFGLLALSGLVVTPVEAPSAPASIVQMARTPEGAVEIQLSDNQQPHRVTQTTNPAAKSGGVVNFAKNGKYVDKTGRPQPGTVVFYRID